MKAWRMHENKSASVALKKKEKKGRKPAQEVNATVQSGRVLKPTKKK